MCFKDLYGNIYQEDDVFTWPSEEREWMKLEKMNMINLTKIQNQSMTD